ncbi:MAG: peptide chain release factor 1 [Candidatus Omnitrophica bacterium]|nr:peptide chain release factor 1 [Candidatus Omnitrophota bacterium]MDD5488633.1 peptide chain release factor 1 [Candidatus Omnitrophota bacterium]
MMNKISDIAEKKKQIYLSLEKELASPELLANREQYKTKAREYAELKDVMEVYDRYRSLQEERDGLERMIEEEGQDSEYSAMARNELEGISEAVEKTGAELEDLLISEDESEYKKNVIMEIRAGTGGVEAGLFAADLYKMYTKLADKMGWRISVISMSQTEKGGIKEIIFSVEGSHVFKNLRFEMGTHRVQRVPETEASGRIHTSAATVAVLPEADDVEVDIKPQDLKIDVYRASGAGGQHVNVTDSAVRITHMPTGVVVSCQDERSQHKNKAKAMRVLKARIFEQMQLEQRNTRSAQRKKQVGSGDRSEKIRTYNFPENRVTDHRINLTIHNLSNILEGDMEALIKGLQDEDRKLKLETM